MKRQNNPLQDELDVKREFIVVCKTLRNISKGASNTASTSAAFGSGLNAFLSESMPITGITLRRCCTNKKKKKGRSTI